MGFVLFVFIFFQFFNLRNLKTNTGVLGQKKIKPPFAIVPAGTCSQRKFVVLNLKFAYKTAISKNKFYYTITTPTGHATLEHRCSPVEALLKHC